MKNIILAGMLTIGAFTSCDKENVAANPDNSPVTVRYDFTATVPANYDMKAVADYVQHHEYANPNSTTWTKTLTVPQDKGGPDSASLTVFPPIEWVGTNIVSDVTLKITVNGVEKGLKNGQLFGVDRPNGIHLSVQY